MTRGRFDRAGFPGHNIVMSQSPLTVYYSPAYVVEGKTETVTKAKLVAEMIEAGKAGEVWLAAEHEGDEALAEEISQLLYWTQVLMVARGLGLDDVYRKL